MFSVILLNGWQLWRIIAELGSRFTCAFRIDATQRMVRAVADFSSKLSDAKIQNRYPSPSKRPDLSQIRSLPFLARARGLADHRAFSRKCLDRGPQNRNDAGHKNTGLREGRKLWLNHPGLLHLWHWQSCPDVSKTTQSAAWPVLPVVRFWQMHLVAMPWLALLSAAARACFVTTPGYVTNANTTGAMAPDNRILMATGMQIPVAIAVSDARGLAASRVKKGGYV